MFVVVVDMVVEMEKICGNVSGTLVEILKISGLSEWDGGISKAWLGFS